METTSSDHATCGRINGLIVACTDDVLAQTAAGRVMVSAQGRKNLSAMSGRRDAFITALTAEVVRLKGTPARGGSLSVGVRASLHRLRATMFGANPGDEYGVCARVEARTERAYAKALLTTLPDPVRRLLEAQHAEIDGDREELRRLCFGFARQNVEA